MDRHFVTVNGRAVHYQRAGTGPTVVLLPDLPWSSDSVVKLARSLASTFTVLVLDLPGYGNSDRLREPNPDVASYADSVAATIEALGITRCSLYGVHLSAVIGLTVAVRHPARIAGLVLEGLPSFTDEERTELAAGYCPKFEPVWSGAHVIDAWSWCRDQSTFWPWFRRTAQARLNVEEPAPTVLHQQTMDVLRAGDRYGDGLVAAFRCQVGPLLDQVGLPVAVIAAEGDPFAPHLSRLIEGGRSPTVQFPPWEGVEGLHGLLGQVSGSEPPAPPASLPNSGGLMHSYIETAYGRMRSRHRLGTSGRPLVMLHASPTSALPLEPLMERLAEAERGVIAFDTPGNGDSEPIRSDQAPLIADFAAAVGEAIGSLGYEEFHVFGSHTGALIAAELAVRDERVGRVILEGVTLFDDGDRPDLLPRAELLARYLPAFQATSEGTHLLAAWAYRRSFTMYWPWYDTSPRGIRWVSGVPLATFHRNFVEFAKNLATYADPYRAALGYPTAARLPLVKRPVLIATHPEDPLHAYSEEAASLVGTAERWELPDDLDAIADRYGAFLD